ncbi:MAG: hypothetical protein IKF38_06930, partial [Clostridia bacterium]|nr:hypothetical protein [Clostridia bacterium]
QVIENEKENPIKIRMIWLNTKAEAQQKNANLLPQIIEYTKSNPTELEKIKINTDSKVIINYYDYFYAYNKGVSVEEVSPRIKDRIFKLYSKNKNIISTINDDFLENDDLFEKFSEEQILRITNYPEVQNFIVEHDKNQVMGNVVKVIMQNDSNWIISLNKMMQNEGGYAELINNITGNNDIELTDRFTRTINRYIIRAKKLFWCKKY